MDGRIQYERDVRTFVTTILITIFCTTACWISLDWFCIKISRESPTDSILLNISTKILTLQLSLIASDWSHIRRDIWIILNRRARTRSLVLLYISGIVSYYLYMDQLCMKYLDYGIMSITLNWVIKQQIIFIVLRRDWDSPVHNLQQMN